jgi:hypothetical protein
MDFHHNQLKKSKYIQLCVSTCKGKKKNEGFPYRKEHRLP